MSVKAEKAKKAKKANKANKTKTKKDLGSLLSATIAPLVLALLLSGCSIHRCPDSQVAGEHEQMTIYSPKTIQSPITIYSPITEEITEQPLSVQGKIPEWINGTLVRNGPVNVQLNNPMNVQLNGPVNVQLNNEKQCHWFDGLAMLHAFTFNKGTITYSNKFLKTEAYQEVFEKGNLDFTGFASISRHPILDRIKSFFRPKNCPPLQNANVNVAKVSEQYCAFTETPLPVLFDLKTADTLGALSFEDKLPKSYSFESAHPKIDGKTLEQFNYLVDFGFRTKYVLYKYDPNCPYRHTISKIRTKNPAYMHSFALTENYIILVEFPLVVNPFNIMFMTKPFISNYYWQPHRGTNFIVIDRNTGEIVKELRSEEPFFAFHHVNAYELKDKINIDIVTYANASIIPKISQHGYLSSHFGVSENLPSPKLVRYTLSLLNDCIDKKLIFEDALELPRINEKYMGHAYRYVYGSDQRLLFAAKDIRSIYKIDLKTNKIDTWSEPGVLPGEAIFIPHPNAQKEDDGVVTNIVLDLKNRTAFLLILDGRTFKEIARIYVPFEIPLGLHAQFF